MSRGSRGAGARDPGSNRILEVMAVLLLGIATVGSAWCGYQATRWNGEEGRRARAASDAQVEGARLFALGTQILAYDSNMIAQYATAVTEDNGELQKFIRSTLVRAEFLPTFDAWEADVKAGQTPVPLFEDEEYLAEQFGGFRATQVLSVDEQAAGLEASENTDAYVLTTLILASALFFAGVTTSFRVRFARIVLLAGSTLLIAYAASRLAELAVV